jgi:hypothetical protein
MTVGWRPDRVPADHGSATVRAGGALCSSRGGGRQVAGMRGPAGSGRGREERGTWTRGLTREKKRSGSSLDEQ